MFHKFQKTQALYIINEIILFAFILTTQTKCKETFTKKSKEATREDKGSVLTVFATPHKSHRHLP